VFTSGIILLTTDSNLFCTQIKDTKLNECLAASNSHLLIEIQGAATRLLHDKSPVSICVLSHAFNANGYSFL